MEVLRLVDQLMIRETLAVPALTENAGRQMRHLDIGGMHSNAVVVAVLLLPWCPAPIR